MFTWHVGPDWAIGVGIIGSLIWLAVIVAVIFLVVRMLSGTRHTLPPPGGESPEDVLRRRFANGEIDEDEYRRRLDVLRRG